MNPVGLRADTTAVVVPLAEDPRDALCRISFEGRRIWTARANAGGWDSSTGELTLPWPAALAPHLAGWAAVEVEVAHGDGDRRFAAEVQFGDSEERFTLLDPASGLPLIVNKWGRLAKSFEGKSADFIDHVLDSTEELITLLRESMHIELFVTGGTLLGPVRDGRVMPNDDDADLAYLSEHENPSDVASESFAMERLLKSRGFDVVRHSSGHLQIMFPGHALTDDYYVDIFSYFVCNGWFYGTFHARERAEEVPIYPLGTVSVNERSMPAPADPAAMLAAIYGPSWRTPDPAFRFVTPEPAARRYYWWLNHFDADREDWEDHHRGLIAAGNISDEPSAFALWVADHLTDGSSVVEFGCGLGAAARHYASVGHRVFATDYSRPAIHYSQSGLGNGNPEFVQANQYSPREMAAVLRRSAALPGQIDVVSEHLFDGMHYWGWDVTMKITRHLLNRGGCAFFSVGSGAGTDCKGSEPRGAQLFDKSDFEHRLTDHGLELLDRRDAEPEACENTENYFYQVKKA